jgi:hypothetical protein
MSVKPVGTRAIPGVRDGPAPMLGDQVILRDDARVWLGRPGLELQDGVPDHRIPARVVPLGESLRRGGDVPAPIGAGRGTRTKASVCRPESPSARRSKRPIG